MSAARSSPIIAAGSPGSERSQGTREGGRRGLADPDLAFDPNRIEEPAQVVAVDLGALQTRAAIGQEPEPVTSAPQPGERVDGPGKRSDPRLTLARIGVRHFANEFAFRRKPKPFEGLRQDRAARSEHVLARQAAPLAVRPEVIA
jgi:hypothetical protein